MTTRQQHYAELAKLVKGAQDALSAAQAYADVHGLEFSFKPAYGMGGYYYGQNHPDARNWNSSSCEYETSADEDAVEPGWHPSSQSC